MTNSDTAPPVHEVARRQALQRYRVRDSNSDDFFAAVATLAARCVGTPMAAVSLVDHDHIWWVGVAGDDSTAADWPREGGLRGDAAFTGPVYVVADALTDPRAAGNQFVGRHGIRFYACAPIVAAAGHRLGAVAVMDTAAGDLSDPQAELLRGLADTVMSHLEAQRSARAAFDTERRQRVAAQFARDDALQDWRRAQHDRDDARSDIADARRARDDARTDRDDAVRALDTSERERDLIERYATVLQRTLLPPSLPDIDGVALAAHYHPASSREIGGDFYDVFALGDGRWAFFIGDVEGHGAEAAAATSLIRYTLRSLALHHRDLLAVLYELNAVLLREDNRRFCTLLYGTLVPAPDGVGQLISVATGGHTPGLLIDPATASSAVIRPDGGMLIGATADAQFEACSVRLRPGQTLLVYTDGLTEARRGENPFDERTLAAFCRQRAGVGAVGLVEELATIIPVLQPGDDVAVLAIEAR